MKNKSLYIPNILTTLRLIGCLLLVFLVVPSTEFYLIYVLTGLTDILDGFLARRLHAETKFGAVYDSISDLIFVIVCILKIFPTLTIQLWLWIVIMLIILIKIINLISGLVIFKKAIFLHTKANKITGLLLFICPLLFNNVCFLYYKILLCVVAVFAAIEEGHLIRLRKV